jgi:hypothetical protein
VGVWVLNLQMEYNILGIPTLNKYLNNEKSRIQVNNVEKEGSYERFFCSLDRP